MAITNSELRLFVSGELVQTGVYRDIVTGATVRICEPDTLPEGIRIVREQRLFMRLVDTSEERTATSGERPRELVEIA